MPIPIVLFSRTGHKSYKTKSKPTHSNRPSNAPVHSQSLPNPQTFNHPFAPPAAYALPQTVPPPAQRPHAACQQPAPPQLPRPSPAINVASPPIDVPPAPSAAPPYATRPNSISPSIRSSPPSYESVMQQQSHTDVAPTSAAGQHVPQARMSQLSLQSTPTPPPLALPAQLHPASVSQVHLQSHYSGPIPQPVVRQPEVALTDRQDSSLQQLISSRLDAIITSMDEELFSGEERELDISEDASSGPTISVEAGPHQPYEASRSIMPAMNMTFRRTTGARVKRTNYFSKVWQYRNARLPPNLPPLKVYMPTWPLLSLAAQYSMRAYVPSARAGEREIHIGADRRIGTKAMVLKSVAVDDVNAIVLAIRGSQKFSDWTVNFRSAPVSPEGFLDDSGNLCHAGFLSVARSMIAPTAAQLEAMLSEHSSRSSSSRNRNGRRAPSLLLTGHSAGAAVAQLIYAHLTSSSSIDSPLKALLPFFKRVHCVTFGPPPVSLLPLQPPSTSIVTGNSAAKAPALSSTTLNNSSADLPLPARYWRKSIFFTFVNEGDPVARADPAVLRSLLRLYASTVPSPSAAPTTTTTRAAPSVSALPQTSPHVTFANAASVSSLALPSTALQLKQQHTSSSSATRPHSKRRKHSKSRSSSYPNSSSQPPPPPSLPHAHSHPRDRDRDRDRDRARSSSRHRTPRRRASTDSVPPLLPSSTAAATATAGALQLPTWPVPESAMSLAGRVILLRTRSRHPSSTSSTSPSSAYCLTSSSPPPPPDHHYHGAGAGAGAGPGAGTGGGGRRPSGSHGHRFVEACVVSDEMMRGVVFGDPMCHMMKLYARRVEELATRAVLVRG